MKPIFNSGTRLGTFGSLLVGALFTGSQDASAQTVTSSAGPVCSVEYVPYSPPSSFDQDHIKVTTSTAEHCYAPRRTHIFCVNTPVGSGFSSRCPTQHRVYTPVALNALYESAVRALASELWMITGGICTTTSGVTTCTTTQGTFSVPQLL